MQRALVSSLAVAVIVPLCLRTHLVLVTGTTIRYVLDVSVTEDAARAGTAKESFRAIMADTDLKTNKTAMAHTLCYSLQQVPIASMRRALPST